MRVTCDSLLVIPVLGGDEAVAAEGLRLVVDDLRAEGSGAIGSDDDLKSPLLFG